MKWTALVLCCGLLSGCVDIEVVDVDIRIGWFVRLSDESGAWKVVEGPVRRTELSGERGQGSTVLVGYRVEDLPGIDDPRELVGQLRVPETCERSLPSPGWSWTDATALPESLRLAVGEAWKPCWEGWGCDPKRCQTNIMKVSAGEAHACAVSSLGTPYCWARTNTAITGRARNAAEDAFEVPGLDHKVDIVVGAYHSCAASSLLDDRTIDCWGANHQSQLLRNTPTVDPILRDPLPISAGYRELVSLEGNSTCVMNDSDYAECRGEGYGTFFAPVVQYGPPEIERERAAAFDIGNQLVCMISEGNARCATADIDYWDDTEPFAHDVELLSAHGQRACASGESSVRCWDFLAGSGQTYEMPNGAKPLDLDLSDAGWCVVFDDGQLHCEHPSLTTDRLPADIRVRPYPGSISLSKDKAACLILSDQSVRCTGTTTSTIVPLPRPN